MFTYYGSQKCNNYGKSSITVKHTQHDYHTMSEHYSIMYPYWLLLIIWGLMAAIQMDIAPDCLTLFS